MRMHRGLGDDVRLLNIDTGRFRTVQRRAGSVVPKEPREIILGRLQTHIVMRRRDTRALELIPLYQFSPGVYEHPALDELCRAGGIYDDR